MAATVVAVAMVLHRCGGGGGGGGCGSDGDGDGDGDGDDSSLRPCVHLCIADRQKWFSNSAPYHKTKYEIHAQMFASNSWCLMELVI